MSEEPFSGERASVIFLELRVHAGRPGRKTGSLPDGRQHFHLWYEDESYLGIVVSEGQFFSEQELRNAVRSLL